MKRPLNLLNIILLLGVLLLSLPGFAANGDDSEKKRTISKSFPVTSSDKLAINNSFGDVVINTWTKNEFKVDIEIKVEANSEEKAQSMLDNIGVSDDRSGNTISFITSTEIKNKNGDNSNKNKNEGNNRKFEINYIVYMPAANALKIENQFGKITIPDFSGSTNLTSKFGGLTAGKLDNVEEIDVEFGTAEIGQVNNGKVSFKFNSKAHIDKLSGSVKINSEFSGNVQLNIEDNIQELSVNESYSTIRMVANKELSANFDVHTSFGSFHNRTDFKITEDKDEDESAGPKFDKEFSGKAGEGRGKIKIKSSFGSVSLSNIVEKDTDDDKEDRKDRKEKREKKEKKEKAEISI